MFEEGDMVVITKAISQPYIKKGEVWELLFKDPDQEWWGQKSEFETKFLLMRDQVEFAHFKTINADFIEDMPDCWPYLVAVYEQIGVFEYPKSYYVAEDDLKRAKKFKQSVEIWQTANISIFKIPVWPERRRK